MYLQQSCFDGSRRIKPFKTTPRCSDQYVYVGFSRRKILRSLAYTIAEKAIRFRHPDGAQMLISSSMSRHMLTCNISSKSMHAFLSNLANRQTDRQTRANAFTSSIVGGKNWCKITCEWEGYYYDCSVLDCQSLTYYYTSTYQNYR